MILKFKSDGSTWNILDKIVHLKISEGQDENSEIKFIVKLFAYTKWLGNAITIDCMEDSISDIYLLNDEGKTIEKLQ